MSDGQFKKRSENLSLLAVSSRTKVREIQKCSCMRPNVLFLCLFPPFLFFAFVHPGRTEELVAAEASVSVCL